MMSGVHCPVCQSDNTLKQGGHTDRRRAMRGIWYVWTCSECEAGFLHPMPTESELAAFYRDHYYDTTVTHTPQLVRNAVRSSPRIRKLFHWLTGDVDPRDFIQFKSEDVILDFGCGVGSYMTYFADSGANIVGAELSVNALESVRAKGLEAYAVSNMKHLPFEAGIFDIIYAMQVVEHISHPHDFVKELVRISKPDVDIYLALPNFASIWKGVFKKSWISGWFIPFHVINYTDRSLRYLAQSHELRIVKVWKRTPTSWFLLNWGAAIDKGNNRVAGLSLPRPLVLVVCVVLRIVELFIPNRDCLVAVLRKKEADSMQAI